LPLFQHNYDLRYVVNVSRIGAWTHDALFECGIVEISPDLCVTVATEMSPEKLGYALHEFITKHTRQDLRTPKRHPPDPMLIQKRNATYATSKPAVV